jgi:hypothetical protein
MLTTSSTITNYLTENSVNMLPHVTSEWNYNLIYAPFATYAGSGAGIDTSQMTSSTASWIKQSNTNVSITATGKVTSSFTDPTAIQISVTPTGTNYTSIFTNYQGSASFSLSNVSNPLGCYKVVFYAKSINNDVINLVTQGNTTTSPLNGSSYVELDNLDWKLVELKVGQKITDFSYSALNLLFDITNNNLSSSNPWGILISNVKIYEISFFDYCYGNLWSTNEVFSWFRPGESYIRSGNSSFLDSDILSLRNLKTSSSGGIITPGWTTQAPCSSVTYSPRIIFSKGQNPIFKNGVLSQFSQYKYFVSEKPTGVGSVPTSIGATYAEILKVNKIVIKLNISQSIPDNIVVTLKDSSTGTSTPIAVPKSYINAAGIVTLYWNGTGWGVTKWTWTPGITNGMPHIDSTGSISMYVGGSSLIGYKNIDSIIVTQNSSSIISNFLPYYPEGSDTNLELKRLQVIEISPRLEVDISDFVIDFNIKKEFDNKNTPLPISSISANSASVNFSNIPLTGINNSPLSIFSTTSNSTSYKSPFSNMLVKNVKLYLNYYFPTKSNEVIPAGVFYVDTWSNQDIKQTTASCFDIMKILQTIPVYDYVAQSQSPQNIFSNILDFSGFTDYNYDDLISALSDNNQKIVTHFFFADSTNKTAYTALEEALLAYQIGCWVDEYGVLRFRNLNNVLSNTTPSLTINDGNVILDSFSENIKTKIGKILMKYRSPQIKRNLTNKTGVNSLTSILQQAPDIIWQPDSEDLVTFNLLGESMLSASQNYYSVDQSSYLNPFFTNVLGLNQYRFVENEIISTGDMEWRLVGYNADGTPTGNRRLVYVYSVNELDAEVAKFSNDYNDTNVSKEATGKFMNVRRGLFGSTASPHYIMSNDVSGSSSSIYAKYFNTYLITSSTTEAGVITSNPSISNNNTILAPVSSTTKINIAYNKNDNGYSTYSVKFRLPKNIDQVEGGLKISSGSDYYYVNILQNYDVKKGHSYTLSIYKYVGGTTLVKLTKDIDVTSIINADFKNEPTDALFETELSRFINLKFVNGNSAGQRVVYINKHRILIDRRSQKKNTAGKYIYGSYWADATNTSDGIFFTSFPSSFLGNQIRFRAASSIATTSVELAEMYASEDAIDSQESYHFQTKKYLNGLISGYNQPINSFFIQSRPQMIGLNIYDVQLALSPSIGAEFFKVSYAFPYYPNNDTSIQPNKFYVREDALGYSEVMSTGFRAKFAIANNSNYAVYLKTDQSYTQLAIAQLLVASRSPILLTPQLTLERVINKNLINEVVEVQSDWIQSKESAESILKILAQSSDPFSKDISIQIFGNPKIQIGDVISLTYTLKNIQSISFFVSGLEQNWQNGGLSTTLTLNQLNYSGSSRDYAAKQYPSNINSLSAPIISSVSPRTGTDAGGTNVAISGSQFANNATVLFGNNEAKISSLSSTLINVVSPPSSIDGDVDIEIVSNGAVAVGKVSSLQGFTYTPAPSVVKTVTSITVTQGTISAGAYPVTVTWTLDTNSSNLYSGYNLTIDNGFFRYNPGNTSDSDNNTGASHTYTTAAWISAGQVVNVSLIPLYTDSTGVLKNGTVATAQITIAAPPVSGPSTTVLPPIITNYQFASDLVGNTKTIVFNFTKGANAPDTYLFMDGIAGGNRINGPTANYWTSNSITLTGISATSHTFYFYGYDHTTLTQSTYSTSVVVDLSQIVAPPPASAPPAPTISNPVYQPINTALGVGGYISVQVPYDNTLGGYQVFIDNETVPYDNPYQTLSNVGGYARILSTNGHEVGKTYSITARAYSSSGIMGPLSTPLSYTVVDPQITVSIDSSLNITWSAPVSAGYINFTVASIDNAGTLDSFSAVYNTLTSTWTKDATTTITTAGGIITFVDNRYSTTLNNHFKSGGTLSVRIIGNTASGPYTTAPITQTIPTWIQIPSMSTVYAVQNGVGASFTWGDILLPVGSPLSVLGYQVEWYDGTNSLGLPNSINNGTGYAYHPPTGPDTYYAYFEAYGSMYGLTTNSVAHPRPLYCRARGILSDGTAEYATAWNGISIS